MKIMKTGIMLFTGILFVTTGMAQKYFTKDGKISFYSDTPMEKIEANNTKAVSVYDVSTGQLEFAALIKAFQFEKALMQEHFNENYLESNTYPKATFKGKVTEPGAVDFGKDGKYQVQVAGELTIHGVTKQVSTPATFQVTNGHISGSASFNIEVEEYGIKIPSIVREKIAKEVKIDVQSDYLPMQEKS